MATFAFKQYNYTPTALRSKSTATRRKPTPKSVNIFDKIQHVKPNNITLDAPPRPTAVVTIADDSRGDGPGVRGTGTVYGGSGKENNNKNENDDDDDDDGDLPTIEELVFTKLQGRGFAVEDRGPDKTSRGVEEATAEDQTRSALGDNSSGSPEDPIVLLGDDDLSASEAEVDDNGLRAESIEPGAGLFDSPEAAIDSTTPAPPSSSDGWHDIDDFPETAPRLRLAEHGASTPNSIRPRAPPSRLSSEPFRDSTNEHDDGYNGTDNKSLRIVKRQRSAPPPRNSILRRASTPPLLHNDDGEGSKENIDHSNLNKTGDDDVRSKRRKVSAPLDGSIALHNSNGPSRCAPSSIAGDDGTNSISMDSNLASTAKTTPAFEYAPQTESKLCPQVIDADRDWEVRKIVGKEYVNGVLHYLVDWYPTLLPEHSLEHAKELVEDFEARLRTQRDVKNVRVDPYLEQGRRAVVQADASGGQQQKRPRGRPRRQT